MNFTGWWDNREENMKKVTLATIAALTLLLTGCNHNTATEPSREQETEQVETKQSSSKEETSNKGTDLKDAPTTLTGDEDYTAVVAYKLQKELGQKNGEVRYYDGNLVVALDLYRDYLDKTDAQGLADSIYILKEAVLKQYNADHGSHKRVHITLVDKDAKGIAHQKGVTMVLDY